MKDYQEEKEKKKKPKKKVGYRTSKSYLRQANRNKIKKHMGARPRALGGRQ
jgi:hypothetical protein